MMLDISPHDRKVLYGMQRKLIYMQAQANTLADQYTDDSAEGDAVADVGSSMTVPLMKIDDILVPD